MLPFIELLWIILFILLENVASWIQMVHELVLAYKLYFAHVWLNPNPNPK